MGKFRAKRVCACGCGKKYRPENSWQKYATPACKNRAAQRRVRERAREAIRRLVEIETKDEVKAESANG